MQLLTITADICRYFALLILSMSPRLSAIYPNGGSWLSSVYTNSLYSQLSLVLAVGQSSSNKWQYMHAIVVVSCQARSYTHMTNGVLTSRVMWKSSHNGTSPASLS